MSVVWSVCMGESTAHRKATPILFDRQRQLLALLDAFGGTAGNLDFQNSSSCIAKNLTYQRVPAVGVVFLGIVSSPCRSCLTASE